MCTRTSITTTAALEQATTTAKTTKKVAQKPVHDTPAPDTQHQTLQSLAAMLWEALDDASSSSEDDADHGADDNLIDAPPADDTSGDEHEEPNPAPPAADVDPTSLTWAPLLQLDQAALPSAMASSLRTASHKEPGLAAQVCCNKDTMCC